MPIVETVVAITVGPKALVETSRATWDNLRGVSSTLDQMGSDISKAVHSSDNIVEQAAYLGFGTLAMGGTAVVGGALSVAGGAVQGVGRTAKWLFGG